MIALFTCNMQQIYFSQAYCKQNESGAIMAALNQPKGLNHE